MTTWEARIEHVESRIDALKREIGKLPCAPKAVFRALEYGCALYIHAEYLVREARTCVRCRDYDLDRGHLDSMYDYTEDLDRQVNTLATALLEIRDHPDYGTGSVYSIQRIAETALKTMEGDIE